MNSAEVRKVAGYARAAALMFVRILAVLIAVDQVARFAVQRARTY